MEYGEMSVDVSTRISAWILCRDEFQSIFAIFDENKYFLFPS